MKNEDKGSKTNAQNFRSLLECPAVRKEFDLWGGDITFSFEDGTHLRTDFSMIQYYHNNSA